MSTTRKMRRRAGQIGRKAHKAWKRLGDRSGPIGRALALAQVDRSRERALARSIRPPKRGRGGLWP